MTDRTSYSTIVVTEIMQLNDIIIKIKRKEVMLCQKRQFQWMQ